MTFSKGMWINGKFLSTVDSYASRKIWLCSFCGRNFCLDYTEKSMSMKKLKYNRIVISTSKKAAIE